MRVLLDTDIGSDIDDALALLLLLRLPNTQLLGVTTVYGKVDLRAKVAKKILDAAGLHVPIVAGASVPLCSPMAVWHAGTEGRGILSDEELAAPIEEMGIGTHAEEFIIETIDAYPHDVTIVSLGALTNVAGALRKKPNVCSKLKGFFFMGGGVSFRSPMPSPLEDGRPYCAEPSHNVRCDAEAARVVFESDIRITVLTNDVTTKAWWDGQPVQNLIHAHSPPEAGVVGKLLAVWLEYRTQIFGRRITGTCPHDPLTVAEATGHSFVSYTLGTMTINPDASSVFVPSPQGRHKAGVSVDSGGFLEWFSDRLASGGS